MYLKAVFPYYHCRLRWEKRKSRGLLKETLQIQDDCLPNSREILRELTLSLIARYINQNSSSLFILIKLAS